MGEQFASQEGSVFAEGTLCCKGGFIVVNNIKKRSILCF